MTTLILRSTLEGPKVRTLRLIKGGSKVFYMELRDENDRPFDLTGYDLFQVCIPTSGDPLAITQTATAAGSLVSIEGDVVLGVLKVDLKATDADDLEPDERLAIDLEIDIAATPNPIRERFEDALNVINSICT